MNIIMTGEKMAVLQSAVCAVLHGNEPCPALVLYHSYRCGVPVSPDSLFLQEAGHTQTSYTI